LLLAIAFQTGVFVVAQRDVPVDDALAYTEQAYAIAQDPTGYFHTPANHPFTMRVGITVPLAALFAVFGVSQITANLPSLFAAIVTLLVVYAAAPTARAKRTGLGFACACTALVVYSTELNADLLCGAASAVSLLLLSRRDRAGWIAAALAAWFFAFLVKETTIWFAPAWLYAIVVDVRTLGWRATARRFAPPLVLGLTLAAGYLAVCAQVWGDPLARVTGINALSGEHLWTPRGRSNGWWLQRLTWAPVRTYIAVFGVAVIVAIVGARRVRGRERLWVVALASFLLIYWFGSASTRAYVPLPLGVHRMLMVGLPCVVVVAALAADALAWRRWIAVLAIAATVTPFTAALVRAVRAEHPEQATHRAIHADLAAPGEVVVVCPDFRCIVAIPFELGYQVPPRLRLVSVVDFARAPPPAPGTRVRVVVKRVRRRVTMFADATTMHAIDALGLPRVYWHRDLRLYDAGDGARLHETLRPLLAP
jgi:hypothetical protein